MLPGHGLPLTLLGLEEGAGGREARVLGVGLQLGDELRGDVHPLLAQGAQPYRPSRTDANVAGDLPVLEVPNNAGNTYGLTSFSIQRLVNDNLALLPRVGEASMQRKTLTFVSHPSTIDATERAAIERLFHALEPYRWDRDAGPLRYVTLSQVAKAYAP